MKKLLTILLASIVFAACSQEQHEHMVLIKTDLGDIKVKLYNDTPIHRENFLKLAHNGKYDGSIFHRILKGFMIQGGGKPGTKGRQDIGQELPAEIVGGHFHKRGALAAARFPETDPKGNPLNPERKSSGSQFYIVQGRIYTTSWRLFDL